MTAYKSRRSYFKMVTLIAFLAVGLVGCDSFDSNETLSELEVQRQRNNPRTSTSPIYTFSDMSEVGTSTLKRGADAITLSIETTQLKPGYAYTVWWVVFDKPEFCSAPACGEDDVFEDAMAGGPNRMELSVIGAADGSVVPANGKATYTGSLKKYDTSLAIFGDGLDFSDTAEIHYVIRSHGAAIPGLIEEQITTFNGGCDPGQPNEGQCEDVQFAVHKAAIN